METDHRKFHDDFSEKLNSSGCRWGSLQIQRLNDETQYIKEYDRSHYEGVESSMKMFIEDILPKIQENTRIAVDKSISATESIKQSEKNMCDFREEAVMERKNSFKLLGSIVAALFLMIAATVWGNMTKINQDSENQTRLEKKLDLLITYLDRKIK